MSSSIASLLQIYDLSDEFLNQAKVKWVSLEVGQLEAYMKWANASTQRRRAVIVKSKPARKLFMHERKKEIMQEKMNEGACAKDVDNKSDSAQKVNKIATAGDALNDPHVEKNEKKKGIRSSTITSSISVDDVSSPRYPPNLSLPPAPASVISSISDAKATVLKQAAYEWSVASEEVRSKYARKAKVDERRFHKDADNIAFGHFLAIFTKDISAQSPTQSSSDVSLTARRVWGGMKTVTRALHFHCGIERLITARFARMQTKRKKTASRNGSVDINERPVGTGQDDNRPGFYEGRRVVCSVNQYVVVKNADPRGAFEVGRLINVFKRDHDSTGSWEINVIMKIIDQGKVAHIAPLVGTGSEAITTVRADEPKTVWVMLPLSLVVPSGQ